MGGFWVVIVMKDKMKPALMLGIFLLVFALFSVSTHAKIKTVDGFKFIVEKEDEYTSLLIDNVNYGQKSFTACIQPKADVKTPPTDVKLTFEKTDIINSIEVESSPLLTSSDNTSLPSLSWEDLPRCYDIQLDLKDYEKGEELASFYYGQATGKVVVTSGTFFQMYNEYVNLTVENASATIEQYEKTNNATYHWVGASKWYNNDDFQPAHTSDNCTVTLDNPVITQLYCMDGGGSGSYLYYTMLAEDPSFSQYFYSGGENSRILVYQTFADIDLDTEPRCYSVPGSGYPDPSEPLWCANYTDDNYEVTVNEASGKYQVWWYGGQSMIVYVMNHTVVDLTQYNPQNSDGENYDARLDLTSNSEPDTGEAVETRIWMPTNWTNATGYDKGSYYWSYFRGAQEIIDNATIGVGDCKQGMGWTGSKVILGGSDLFECESDEDRLYGSFNGSANITTKYFNISGFVHGDTDIYIYNESNEAPGSEDLFIHLHNETGGWNYTTSGSCCGNNSRIEDGIYNLTGIEDDGTNLQLYLILDNSTDWLDVRLSALSVGGAGTTNITNCEAGLTESVHLITASEESPFEKINSTINGYIYYTVNEVDYTYNFTNYTNKHSLCIEAAAANYSVFGHIQYGNASGYDQRDYWLDAEIFDNTSRNFYLYMLNSTKSDRVDITVKDEYGNPKADVVVKVQRWYPEIAAYKTISSLKSDSEGQTNVYLVLYDEYYRFLLQQNGTLLQTINRRKLQDTEIDLLIDPTPLLNWVKHYGLVTGGVKEEGTNLVAFYNDRSGYVTNATFQVYHVGALYRSKLCDLGNTSSTGEMKCSVGNTTTQLLEYTLYVTFSFGENSMIVLESGIWEGGDATSMLFGDCSDAGNITGCREGLFVAILLVLLSTFIGIYSPPTAIVTMLAGVGISVWTGLFALGVWNFIGLIFVGGILIWRMSK